MLIREYLPYVITKDKQSAQSQIKRVIFWCNTENPPLSPTYPPVEGGKPAANERIFS